MFYQMQFQAIQQHMGIRIAVMQADLLKYAARPDASQAAIEARQRIIEDLNNYHEFTANLYRELKEELLQEFNRGRKVGQDEMKLQYEPHRQRISENKELDRYNSITRAREQWPELF